MLPFVQELKGIYLSPHFCFKTPKPSFEAQLVQKHFRENDYFLFKSQENKNKFNKFIFIFHLLPCKPLLLLRVTADQHL